MKTVILLTLFMFACVTPVVSQPAQPKVPSETLKVETEEDNLAYAVCFYTATHTDPHTKCAPTRGRGTKLPDETDAAVCLGTSSILYCQAPDNDMPTIRVLADWTPKGKVEQPKPEPVKSEKPKSK